MEEYLLAAEALTIYYQSFFDQVKGDQTFKQNAEDEAEILLNGLINIDQKLRIFLDNPHGTFVNEIIHQIRNFMCLEGNLRQVSLKDLEFFLVMAKIQLEEIRRYFIQ